jgi:hypothetical protein
MLEAIDRKLDAMARVVLNLDVAVGQARDGYDERDNEMSLTHNMDEAFCWIEQDAAADWNPRSAHPFAGGRS